MALWNRTRALAGAAALALLAGAGAAGAQTTAPTAQASAVHDFDVPAGPLDQAAIRFSEQAGVQLLFDSAAGQGVSARPVHGRLSAAQALDQLLAGTGLTWRFLANGTVTIERPVPGAHMLGAVQVEGVTQQGFAALNGFGAGAGANGSSDPTATEGTGSFTTNGASIASRGAPTALKDTPQSVSVITQERIQQQDILDLTSAMNYTPGITLYYLDTGNIIAESRGFQIHSLQIDGGASTVLNFGGDDNSVGGVSLAEFDNVQVLRGSDALYAGAGDPGGVISLQRKRPLDHDQFLGSFQAGSWNNYDVLADVTGPIAFNGHLRARLVAEYNDRGFFYQTAHDRRGFIYGVLEGDLDPNTVIRAGGSFQNQTDTGPNDSGLPRAPDGGDLHLPVWTNFSPPWTNTVTKTSELFLTIEHRFNDDWHVTADVTRTWLGNPRLQVQEFGLVLPGGGGSLPYQLYEADSIKSSSPQYTADITVNGKFKMLGLDQSVSAGADFSDAYNSFSEASVDPGTLITNVYHFNPATLGPQPATFGPTTVTSTFSLLQWGAYANVNIQPLPRLHIAGGVRISSWFTSGFTDYFGNPDYASTSYQWAPTPYGSITYGVTHDISVYASYADIFNSNGDAVDHNGKLIPPTVGATYQTGIKGAFRGGKLNASLEFYYTAESNVAIYDGNTPYPPPFPGCCYFNSGAYISHGVDFEVAGELLPGWQAQFGYSFGENYYNDNLASAYGTKGAFESQEPKHQVKLWTAYTAPSGPLSRWTFAGGLKIESARYTQGQVCAVPLDSQGNCPGYNYTPFQFTQGLYSVVDLTIGYRIDKHWQAQFSATNIADTRYYATAGNPYSSNFYGDPRAFMFTVRAKY